MYSQAGRESRPPDRPGVSRLINYKAKPPRADDSRAVSSDLAAVVARENAWLHYNTTSGEAFIPLNRVNRQSRIPRRSKF